MLQRRVRSWDGSLAYRLKKWSGEWWKRISQLLSEKVRFRARRYRNESRHTLRRQGDPTQREDGVNSETADRHRWKTDSVAHNEDLFQLRIRRLHSLPRV